MKYRYTQKFKNLVAWVITVVLSLVLLVGLNAFFTKDLQIMSWPETTIKAKVTELGEAHVTADYAGAIYASGYQLFNAKVLSGPDKGTIVTASQDRDNFSGMNDDVVKPGDKVILYTIEGGPAPWTFGSYARFDAVLVFGAIFLLLLLVFGLWKGLNTIISLAFTCLAVFAVFIPSVLAGYNVYLMTCVVCVYIIVMTLVLTNGITQKSITTMIGCGFGVLMAAVLSVLMDSILHLTGILDEHSVYIQMMGTNKEIDLKALIFAMIVIGALGAVMDVAMDISSSLHEVQLHAANIGFKELFMSGIRIGRDIMGTMANTLVLAYIGSSLCSVLLYVYNSMSFLELFNRENIVVEIMQSLIGSTSILLTIPLTSLVCCLYYRRKK